MVVESKKKSTIWSGYGLILGAVVGTLLFIITKQAWHIGVGAGIGLVLGSAIGLRSALLACAVRLRIFGKNNFYKRC